MRKILFFSPNANIYSKYKPIKTFLLLLNLAFARRLVVIDFNGIFSKTIFVSLRDTASIISHVDNPDT